MTAQADRAINPAIIALHCSGGSGRQWRHLAQALGDRFLVIAPDLIGHGTRPHWDGARPFRFGDEAAHVTDIIDAIESPVHLVGHSYGGGVALRVAVERPHRIASLTLYEPSAFHLLRSAGPDAWNAFMEIRAVAEDVARNVTMGACRHAARRFVDYWSGEGSWDALRPQVQAELVRYIPKACLEFRALMDERTPLVAYQRLGMPILLMQGEFAPEPTAQAASRLFRTTRSRAQVIAGAGHMGPLTHVEAVNRLVVDHVLESAPQVVAGGERALDAAA